MDSKDYSWKWITASEILSQRACDLIYAALVPSAATTDSYLYDGEDATGEAIVNLAAATKRLIPFSPKIPVYCRRGLYVSVGTHVTGIFVMWRVRDKKEG